MPSYSFDGRDKKNEIRDLLFERSGLINENRTRKPRFSSPIENALIRTANKRRIREIEIRLNELAIA
jgi:hypothetical protein